MRSADTATDVDWVEPLCKNGYSENSEYSHY
jgi:hypothetical protein